jgi:hypothetical protein
MTKLVKPLKIAIDLQSLVDKKITEDTKNLLNCSSWKGALGTVTILSDVFDLYLLVPQCHLLEPEILRWLKAAQIDVSFRKFFTVDETIRDIILASSINVTITSTEQLAEKLKDVSKIYFLQKKHNENIQNGICYVSQWREIIRDISFFSTE